MAGGILSAGRFFGVFGGICMALLARASGVAADEESAGKERRMERGDFEPFDRKKFGLLPLLLKLGHVGVRNSVAAGDIRLKPDQ